jgi:g-D-glutamyl-meso-diaminopimelate peptidase
VDRFRIITAAALALIIGLASSVFLQDRGWESAAVYADVDSDPAFAAGEGADGGSEEKKKPDAKKMKPKLVTDPKIKPTYARLMDDIRALKKRYPNLVDYRYIGESNAGKKIPLVTFGTGKRKVLITASIHGREFVTTSFVMRSVDTYAYAWAKNQKISGQNVRKILRGITFYFVPMINPDGVAIAEGKASTRQRSAAVKAVGKRAYNSTRRLWKSNARGVDLNRNFPVFWHDQKDADKPGYIGYRGKSAGSEPETDALLKLCDENDFAFLINCHTLGAVIYWDDWYSMKIPGASALTSKVSSVTGYSRALTYRKYAGGTFEKWFRYKYNRPAMVIEFTRSGQSYHSANRNFDRAMSWIRTKALWLKLSPYAKLSDEYKIYYKGNGGKVALKQTSVTRYKTVTKGKAVGKLAGVKARKGKGGDYKFLGWFTKAKGGEKITSKTVYDFDHSIEVYAHWEKPEAG